MRRETQNVLLVLLGGALLKIALNGTYLRYVKPAQLPWLIAAGAVMVLLAAVSIGRDIAAARSRAAAAPIAVDGHQHSSYSSWLLVLPVFAVFLVAPPSLGADAVNRAEDRPAPAPDTSAGNAAMFPPLPPGDAIPMTIRDFVMRAGWDSSDSLRGRTVRLTGFVVRQGESVYLARIVIMCCAADARPTRVRLDGEGLAGLREDTWAEMVVTLQPGSATKANKHVPTATVSQVRPIPEPENPYEN